MPVPSRYVIDPDDPRAPSEEVWASLTEEERLDVLASLPSEIPRALPPEGDAHRIPKAQALESLGEYFRQKGRSVYLSSELPVYYPAEPMFAPDLIAVLDVATHPRPHWVVSHEGKGLDFVLEVHVAGDRRKDTEVNVERLERLQVPEYFVYEPLKARLIGYRLHDATYSPILPQGGRWKSSVLQLDLALDEGRLRFFTGSSPLLDSRELIDQLTSMVDKVVQKAKAEAQRADSEAQRADSEAQRADSEAQRAEHEARRAVSEAQRAEHEARRADSEAQRAEHEARRADTEAERAEHEARRAARLATKLRELGVDPEML